MSGPDGTVSLKPEAALWLRDGCTLVTTTPAVFRVEGPGAVDCLQGVMTSDVVRAGPAGLAYGAMLTPKGMIVVDLWVMRDPEGATLVVPESGYEAALELFTRRLPPRLARLESKPWSLIQLMGAKAEVALEGAGMPLPGPGSSARLAGEAGPLVVARPVEIAPWRFMLLGAASDLERTAGRLQDAGALVGTDCHLEAARILAGWPALGHEIGEKTLPQEVRYDEIGGVSYTKGCYVGQETVARVHFRGHPNRMLRGLLWDEAAHRMGEAVHSGKKEVGHLGSVLEVGSRRYGLALLRHEIDPGSIVTVNGTAARVAELPFPLEGLGEEGARNGPGRSPSPPAPSPRPPHSAPSPTTNPKTSEP